LQDKKTKSQRNKIHRNVVRRKIDEEIAANQRQIIELNNLTRQHTG